MTSRLPMLLRRGLMVGPRLVVDSDPERTAGLTDTADVRVVCRDLVSGAREVFALPAREPVRVLGVIPDAAPARSGAGAALLSRAAVAA